MLNGRLVGPGFIKSELERGTLTPKRVIEGEPEDKGYLQYVAKSGKFKTVVPKNTLDKDSEDIVTAKAIATYIDETGIKEEDLNKIVNTANKYTDDKFKKLIGSADETLDTIEEVAQAIKENEDVLTAVTSAISKKVDKTTKVNGKQLSSDIELTKSDVGLSNVDNTSDLDKPISNAVKVELNKKANKSDIPDNIVSDANYVHTDNNYTSLEKNKLANLSNYDDSAIKEQINKKYTKPSTGISKSDLSSDIIESLNKADSAIQTIPSAYVTETELENKNYATETFVTDKIAEAELGGSDVDVSGLVSKEEIKDYVKKTDYATQSKPGIITGTNTYAVNFNSSGGIMATEKSLSQYESGSNGMFISKGTLENIKENLVKSSLNSTETWTSDEQLNARTKIGAVSSTDYATSTKGGVSKFSASYGITVNVSGVAAINPAKEEDIDAKTHAYKPLTPKTSDYAVKKGLTSPTVEWTDADKSNARSTLGVSEQINDAKSYADGKVASLKEELMGPNTSAALDIINELASALKDNKDVITAINSSIVNKADKSALEELKERVDNIQSSGGGSTTDIDAYNKLQTDLKINAPDNYVLLRSPFTLYGQDMFANIPGYYALRFTKIRDAASHPYKLEMTTAEYKICYRYNGIPGEVNVMAIPVSEVGVNLLIIDKVATVNGVPADIMIVDNAEFIYKEYGMYSEPCGMVYVVPPDDLDSSFAVPDYNFELLSVNIAAIDEPLGDLVKGVTNLGNYYSKKHLDEKLTTKGVNLLPDGPIELPSSDADAYIEHALDFRLPLEVGKKYIIEYQPYDYTANNTFTNTYTQRATAIDLAEITNSWDGSVYLGIEATNNGPVPAFSFEYTVPGIDGVILKGNLEIAAQGDISSIIIYGQYGVLNFVPKITIFGIYEVTSYASSATLINNKPISSNITLTPADIGHYTLTQEQYDVLIETNTCTLDDGTVLNYSDEHYYYIREE